MLNKLRLKNKLFFVSILSLLMILLFTWFIESGACEIIFFMDYNAPDLAGTKSEIQRSFLSSIFVWERYIDSSMKYVMNIFPIFAIIPILPLYDEINSYFIFGAHRFKNIIQ